jgi:hypothetical protein
VLQHDPEAVRTEAGVRFEAAEQAAEGAVVAAPVVQRLTRFLTT